MKGVGWVLLKIPRGDKDGVGDDEKRWLMFRILLMMMFMLGERRERRVVLFENTAMMMFDV